MSPKSGREATLRAILILFIVIPITGCGLGQKSATTSTPVPTLTLAPSSTPTLAPTNAPIPTATIEPSPTPIPLPKGISDIVSNASVEYQDNFNYSFLSPNGWSSCAGNEAVWSAENGHLAINAQANMYGAVFYYADRMIHPNEAVYFLYAYYGNRDFVTLGFDGYINGKVCSSSKSMLGFYSVAMEDMPGLPLTAHSLTSAGQKNSYFEGNWRLQEQNWYGVLMGYDQSNTFFIVIWKPIDPYEKLVFKQTYPDFPKAYNFISWVSASRKVLIDDFTIIKFDNIQE